MKLKRFFLPLITALALSGCSEEAPQSSKYTTLDTPITVQDLPVVTELFSLSCDHCRSIETVIPAIETAANVKIGKTHVTFNESATLTALIYYAAMTQVDTPPPAGLTDDLFTFVQEQQSKDSDKNRAILNELFAKYGLTSPFDLTEAQQQVMFAEMEKADQITVASEITSVPTFIVNGKYVVNTRAHESAEDLADTLKMLMAKGQ
ncbi:thioredoxin domain-containing protein [Grimontia hollisae]|uniref:Thiol:disulfide interchange protein DsbA n=1 Tax=Grimontia hollisae TaxID=673 RepID=A0A377J8F4_GRIHO|nr:thioredoxin domain-containing protein [Grimontia hollisae]MDF2184586.1 thioredoxin domain-containing protein [Grimontia hollisae]STO98515.1 Thiol:disulfide interchange protein DsbA precursor [Grimontia hollisae]STQ75657.1 Thiol:disulfide interchange protein DsbA precursor [Grimontia hollisae]